METPKKIAGGTIEIKFQGFCQGRGAAPEGWSVIIITIIYAHKSKGHGGHFVCPISGDINFVRTSSLWRQMADEGVSTLWIFCR